MKERTTKQGDHISFHEQGHTYNINGEVPDYSITQALNIINKPLLVPAAVKKDVEWYHEQIKAGEKPTTNLMKEAKRQHRHAWSESAEIGTEVHKMIEDFLNDEG